MLYLPVTHVFAGFQFNLNWCCIVWEPRREGDRNGFLGRRIITISAALSFIFQPKQAKRLWWPFAVSFQIRARCFFTIAVLSSKDWSTIQQHLNYSRLSKIRAEISFLLVVAKIRLNVVSEISRLTRQLVSILVVFTESSRTWNSYCEIN